MFFFVLFFHNSFSKYSFMNYYQSVTHLDTDQARPFVGPGLGPNCSKGCQQTIIPVC